jgi:hypothetical protein
VNGAFDDIIVDQNRMLHNDGSGRLCVISNIDSAPTYTVAINSGIESSTTCGTAPTKFLEVGMRVMMVKPDQTIRSVVTVVSKTDTTVELSGTPAADAVGDWLVRASNVTGAVSNDTGFRAEPMGIGGIFSDIGVLDGNGLALSASGAPQTGSEDMTGTSAVNFQGIVVDGNEFNQAVIGDNGGATRPISEALLQQVLSDAEEQNNANIDVLLSSYSTYNSYFNVLKGDKRFVNTLDLQGGHKVLTFNGVGWVKDRHAYGNRVYGLALDQFYNYEVVPLEWLDHDGLKFRKLTDKDDWGATLKTRYTVGVDVRQRCGFLLTDLAS